MESRPEDTLERLLGTIKESQDELIIKDGVVNATQLNRYLRLLEISSDLFTDVYFSSVEEKLSSHIITIKTDVFNFDGNDELAEIVEMIQLSDYFEVSQASDLKLFVQFIVNGIYEWDCRWQYIQSVLNEAISSVLQVSILDASNQIEA